MTELAVASGEFILPHFARPDLPIETKADKSLVTVADRGAEQLMREMIHRRFPDHGIVGEEFGNENETREFVWVLDPIDGTNSFAAACPLFGTLIALCHQGRPILGAIHQPVLRQLMVGDNKTTELNGRQVRVRPCGRIEEAVILTSDTRNLYRYQDGAAFMALADRARLFRTWGDCYGYLLLSSAWADAMCDPVMNPWDIAALVPVVRGAGGVITDWKGNEPMTGTSIIAAGPALHAQVLAGLSR